MESSTDTAIGMHFVEGSSASLRDSDAELDRRLEEYYGDHIYVRLREGDIPYISDLKIILSNYEYRMLLVQLHQAVKDIEYFRKHAYTTRFNGNYPRAFSLDNGENKHKRHVLIQVFI